ncbi:MAG: alpha/beta hydrolase [Flavobacteriaceae bacterium]|nr:alpha/beta hydrolase [Flavobacteriaceae bacterium]
MRKIVFAFICLLIISCNTKEKKPVDIIEKETQSNSNKESVHEPNIFVVKTRFPSKEGLLISADIYEVNGKKPTVLLCHQAGFSRGEYKDTAIKLAYLGYASLAIDQRSGKIANEITNETAQRARDKSLPTGFLDARQDIEAAIDYLYDMNGNQPIILVGSSYSASLVLLIGKENEKVKAVASFSPGEYLKGIRMSDKLQDYKKPVFVTSSKKEVQQVKDLKINVVKGDYIHFEPSFEGVHGSRALWESTEGNDEYWKAFEIFLDMINQKTEKK